MQSALDALEETVSVIGDTRSTLLTLTSYRTRAQGLLATAKYACGSTVVKRLAALMGPRLQAAKHGVVQSMRLKMQDELQRMQHEARREHLLEELQTHTSRIEKPAD